MIVARREFAREAASVQLQLRGRLRRQELQLEDKLLNLLDKRVNLLDKRANLLDKRANLLDKRANLRLQGK